MIKNHFKTAWRNLLRHRTNAFINALGLFCAFSFTALIAAFIWQETRVDKSIKHIDRQYLLSGNITGITTAGMLARTLHEEHPDLVEEYFRFDGITAILSHDNHNIQQSALIADSSFFKMFGFKLASGNEHTALSEPTHVVLTHETAIMLFGHANAVGEQVEAANFRGEKQPFMVSGVLEPFPQNSVTHLIADDPVQVIFPAGSALFFGRQLDSWDNPYIASFITLKPNVDPRQLDTAVERLLKEHVPENQLQSIQTRLLPLAAYHLKKDNGAVTKMLITLGIAGAFILLMACINFVNISINTAANRVREIGVRKVIGGSPGHLRIQFLSESLLIAVIGAAAAIGCYPLLSGAAAGIFGKPLPSFGNLGIQFWITLLLCFLLIGMIAGLYPAFRLSSYRIIQALKGKLALSFERTLVLRGLVSLQLATALVALIATTVIISQISIFFGADLGYDKDYLVTAQVPRDWTPEGTERMERIRQRLTDLPAIESATLSYDVPGAMASGNMLLKGSANAESTISASRIVSDRHFADTFKIPILAGSFFSEGERAASADRVVINETLAKSLGYQHPEEAINQPLYNETGEIAYTISGVSGDFYGNTMHAPAGATIWFNVAYHTAYRYFTIRLVPGNTAHSLQALQGTWKDLMPDAPFEHSFVDDRLKTMYQTELRFQRAGTASAVLAVIIVLLGLVGLIYQSMARRTKEIGIRKVLGASVKQIIALFLKDIGKMFFIAMIIAVPLAYVLMQRWLETYYLKTALDFTKMGIPVIALAILTVLLIVAQTIRLAFANPVGSLRDE